MRIWEALYIPEVMGYNDNTTRKSLNKDSQHDKYAYGGRSKAIGVLTLIASAKESIVGISSPFVGSSNSSILGLSMARRANTIRLFCPSDSVPIKAVWESPLRPYFP